MGGKAARARVRRPGPASGAEPESPAPAIYKRSGSQKRQRNKFWIIALTEEEEARALESAQRVGLSRSSYGRAALLGTPGPRARRKPHVNVVELKKAAAAINKSSNVLNQLLPFLHAGRAVTLGRECDEAAAALRQGSRRHFRSFRAHGTRP